MIRGGHPFAEHPVDGDADIIDAPGLVIGELETGQSAHVLVVFHRNARHDGPDAIDIGVPDKKGSFAVEVVDLT